ncbi:secreted frizzled-related protein 5 isoform X3 [Nilaparvata lugens]|uniref:secreted frizzled-related protein 5 isoform X3 n=1 Tax=Nilaparvata lugens TaxID=108931 RepID=UPI000B99334D|nr:secreted frizzled-related protein 5 isoform X3 [Nilaparvata lugens]
MGASWPLLLFIVQHLLTTVAALSAKCVDIPSSMVLCRGVGYKQMRVPNLLMQESVAEAESESSVWLPLLQLHCAADTQRFLCSLLAPVCLDLAANESQASQHVIQPCRSLCLAVRAGCESRMLAYGYPWPAIFACNNFPLDNDMCIAPAPVPRQRKAVRARLKRIKRLHLTCKKSKVLKGGKQSVSRAKLKRSVLVLGSDDACCEDKAKSSRRQMFLVMGVYSNKDRDITLTPTFIMPWLAKQSNAFKRAVGMFNKLNCTDPKMLAVQSNASVTGMQEYLNDNKPKPSNKVT